MSIVLKKLGSVEDNTTDFALNFPPAAARSKQNKDMISSQAVCFQCAVLFERSIYQEIVVARLPAVGFSGPNKAYVVNQLCFGLTAGLKTGISGVVQLFAGIVDQTLETKVSTQIPIGAYPTERKIRRKQSVKAVSNARSSALPVMNKDLFGMNTC